MTPGGGGARTTPGDSHAAPFRPRNAPTEGPAVNMSTMIDQAIAELEREAAAIGEKIGRLQQMKKTLAKLTDEDASLLRDVLPGRKPGRPRSAGAREQVVAFLEAHPGGSLVAEIVAGTGLSVGKVKAVLANHRNLFDAQYAGAEGSHHAAKRYRLRDPDSNGTP